jgi:hypothetical protein
MTLTISLFDLTLWTGFTVIVLFVTHELLIVADPAIVMTIDLRKIRTVAFILAIVMLVLIGVQVAGGQLRSLGIIP